MSERNFKCVNGFVGLLFGLTHFYSILLFLFYCRQGSISINGKFLKFLWPKFKIPQSGGAAASLRSITTSCRAASLEKNETVSATEWRNIDLISTLFWPLPNKVEVRFTSTLHLDKQVLNKGFLFNSYYNIMCEKYMSVQLDCEFLFFFFFQFSCVRSLWHCVLSLTTH